MNKICFWMLVGLPCSGKSTISKSLSETYNATIFSSDALREELFRDVNDQEHNQELFVELHKRIKDCLRNGKSAIYDACNISYKRRMAFLSELKNTPCEKICMLMATPYEECCERNKQRDRKVPEHVIRRMYMGFDVPHTFEGWDEVVIAYSIEASKTYRSPLTWIRTTKHYNQNNSHHTLTLGSHCEKVFEYLYKNNDNLSDTLKFAALLHDCGKPFCKTFKNTKGEITEQAHYYNHERTGSYDSLFYSTTDNPMDVAILIRWHMQPYFWEKDNNEKLHNKYRKLWGEDLYQDIMKLHEADKAAH